MPYYYYTTLTAIVILTSLTAMPFLASAQSGTNAEGSRTRSMKTTTTENIYESQLGYRLQYPLDWTLTEYPTSVFASALVNAGNALDIALCPQANTSSLEDEDDDSLNCVALTGDKVWVWMYMPVDDDIPSLAPTVREDNGTKKSFIVQGATSMRVLDEFINSTLASLSEVYEQQTDLSIINQTSILVNVTGTSDVNESAAAATNQTFKQQLPAKIVEYVLTEPETFGDGTNEFRRVALFVVDYEENRAFEIEYMPMSALVAGYPEEVDKIFKSFEIIRNNRNNTASLQNNNNTLAETSDSFTAHQ
jgi:hypothetical protein